VEVKGQFAIVVGNNYFNRVVFRTLGREVHNSQVSALAIKF